MQTAGRQQSNERNPITLDDIRLKSNRTGKTVQVQRQRIKSGTHPQNPVPNPIERKTPSSRSTTFEIHRLAKRWIDGAAWNVAAEYLIGRLSPAKVSRATRPNTPKLGRNAKSRSTSIDGASEESGLAIFMMKS